MTSVAALSTDALEVNRQGRLTDEQRQGWAGAARSFRSDFGFAALACAFLGVGLLTGFLSNRPDPARFVGGLGFLVAAAALGYIAAFRGQPLAQDLREGRVASIEGAIGRERVAGTGGQPSSHWLDVGGKRFACGRAAYDAAEQPGMVRLYYLPRSRTAVNFERLPDRPLPSGDVNGAMVALTMVDAISLNRATHDDAMARMIAMEHAITAPDLPPPDAARDPRPLAEAIIGAWRGPMLEAAFNDDGTANASLANGTRMTGRWSVNGDGRLLLDGMGGQTQTEAIVTGDVLSLTFDSMPLTLRRLAS